MNIALTNIPDEGIAVLKPVESLIKLFKLMCSSSLKVLTNNIIQYAIFITFKEIIIKSSNSIK